MRNILEPGDYIMIHPLGCELLLRYNDSGRLDRIITSINDVDVTDKLIKAVFESSVIPTTISVAGASTFIRGTLCSTKYISNTEEGAFAEIAARIYVDKFIEHPEDFKFIASNVLSYFNGAMAVRRWLTMSNFTICPGWMVPENVTSEFLNNAVNSNQFNVFPRLFGGMTIYRNSDVKYYTEPYYQFVANSIITDFDDHGRVVCKIYNAAKSHCLTVDIGERIKHNIEKGDIIIENEFGKLSDSFVPNNKKHRAQLINFVCPVCGVSYDVSISGSTTCPQSDCLSKQYIRAVNMLKHLNLPTISKTKFFELAKTHKILNIIDILDLPAYRIAEPIELDLFTLLRACIPYADMANDSTLKLFINKCNGVVETVLHYVQKPDTIQANLDMTSPMDMRLISWLENPYNMSTILSLASRHEIKVVAAARKFDGAPIFKNKTIYITGIFNHGSKNDIQLILQSYSANVVDRMSDQVNCVIIGDTLEQIDGAAINTAKELDIPIYQENVFFDMYEIDADLKIYVRN